MIDFKEHTSVITNAFIFSREEGYQAQVSPLQVLSLDRFATKDTSFMMPYAVEIHPSGDDLSLNKLHAINKDFEKNSDLSNDDMEKIHRFISDHGVKSIIYAGAGDPLLWRGDIAHYLMLNNGCFKTVVTDGIGLKKILTAECLEKISILQIDIKGFNDENYPAGSAGRNTLFHFVHQNLKTLVHLKKENNLAMRLTAKIIIDRNNYRSLKELLAYCARFKFDIIVVKPVIDMPGEGNNGLDEAALRTVIEDCNGIRDTFRYGYTIDTIPANSGEEPSTAPAKCWTVEYKTNVLFRPDGEVFLCGFSSCSGENSIGNIRESDDIASLWNTRRHRSVIDRLSADMAGCVCNTSVCRHMRYNYLIEGYLD